VRRYRAASGAALGAASGAAFHMAPGLAIQRRVQPASGLSSKSTLPRLLRRVNPDASPVFSRLYRVELRSRHEPRLGQSMSKASELERNGPSLGMGLDLVDRQCKLKRFARYLDGLRTVHRNARVIARLGCVEHLTPPTRSNPDRLSCTINQAHHEQPN
jgi:hypothetical protein